MIATFNEYHLGDNLIHLHFLRKMAQKYPNEEFGHHAPDQHIPQLLPLVADLENLCLLGARPSGCINAWRGDQGFWYGHAHRNDFTRCHFDWFAHLAWKMGLISAINSVEEMLFDYPALTTDGEKYNAFDYLVVNSIPHSNQFRGFNPHEFSALVGRLLTAGHSVVTTAPTGIASCTNDGKTGMDVTSIGNLSRKVRRGIIGIPTGPMWPTFNIWNRDVPRILMLDDERVQLTPNTTHVRNCAEAMEIL